MKVASSLHLVNTRRMTRLSLEPLEPRLLLSGNSWLDLAGNLIVSPVWFQTVSGAQESGSLLDQYGTEQLQWQGQTVEAVKDHWVVQFTASAIEGIGSVAETAGLLTGGVGFEVVRGLGMAGQVLLRTVGTAAQAVESWLSACPSVASFSPDFVFELSAVPNDPYFDQMWGLDNFGQYAGTPGADISVTAAWNLETGSSSVVVAVIDTGVDYTHPDLAANMWVNALEYAGTNGVDDDANGFIDDIYGWDFYDDDADPMDGEGHGTHVAGTIGAVGNNGLGVVGINWDVSIMALRFLGPGGGSTADAVAAVNYATMMRTEYNDGPGDGTPGANVRVTNNSWGGGPYDASLYTAIANSGSAGILFVAAAGNDGNDNDLSASYPASYDLDNIISVAATDPSDNLVVNLDPGWSSNYGRTTVDLGAPGQYILSTMPGGLYGLIPGTSMATPHVSGVAALAWAYNPSATMAKVRDAILAGADPIPSLTGMTVTGGRLNALATLQRVVQPDPVFVNVGTYSNGIASVRIYDVTGPLDVGFGDVQVKFGNGGVISSITIADGDGVGLAIYGASSVGSINDARKGSPPLGFIASNATIKSISTAWGLSGVNLNGRTLGGLVLAADIDGDGLTNDWTALYSGGAILTTKAGRPIEGDVYIGGTDPSGTSIKTFVNRLDGDLYADGSAGTVGLSGARRYDTEFGGFVKSLSTGGGVSGDVLLGGGGGKVALAGNMSGDVLSDGPLSSLSVTGNLSGDLQVDGSVSRLDMGGNLSGNVLVNGSLGRTNIAGDVSFSHIGVDGVLGALTVGGGIQNTVVLAPAMGSILVKGDVNFLWVLAGADLGNNWAIGGVGGNADTYLPGYIGSFKAQGIATDTVVAAGLMPVFGSLDDGLLYESFLSGSYMGRVEVWGGMTGTGGVGSYALGSAKFERSPDPLRPSQFIFLFGNQYPYCFFIVG